MQAETPRCNRGRSDRTQEVQKSVMSIICFAKNEEEQRTACEIKHLFEIIDLRENGSAKFTFVCFLKVSDNALSAINLAIPYERLKRVEARNDILSKFMPRDYANPVKEVGGRYVFEDESALIAKVTEVTRENERLNETRYSILRFKFGEPLVPNTYLFAFTFEADEVAIRLSYNVFYETVWNLDLTLYGPINPSSHLFLDKNALLPYVVRVDRGYIYVLLPANNYPIRDFPPLLEEYFHDRRNLMTWVIGSLDMWYERRIHVTYTAPPSNTLLYFIIGSVLTIIGITFSVPTFSKLIFPNP